MQPRGSFSLVSNKQINKMEREITTIDVFIARHGIHLGERMRAPVDSALLFSKNPEIAGFNLPRIIARGVVSISARDKSRDTTRLQHGTERC